MIEYDLKPRGPEPAWWNCADEMNEFLRGPDGPRGEKRLAACIANIVIINKAFWETVNRGWLLYMNAALEQETEPAQSAFRSHQPRELCRGLESLG